MNLHTRIKYTLRTTYLRRPLLWFRHAGIRAEDVLVAAYPKSGSTWLRFMLGQLLAGREMDFDEARATIPPVGAHRGAPGILPGGGRLIKTHEAYTTRYRRAIYVVRDVRDVAISYYHHQVRQGLFHGELSDFLPRFLLAKVDGYGTWAGHVESWLDSPLVGTGDVCVLKYEAMRADTLGALRAVLELLDVEVADDALRAAVADNTMGRMRSKEAGSAVLTSKRRDLPVVRKGATGEWREVLTAAQQGAFLEAAKPVLERLGYPVGP